MKKLFKMALHFGSVFMLSLVVVLFSGFFGKNKPSDKEGKTTIGGLLGADTAFAEVPDSGDSGTPGDSSAPGSDCDTK